MRGRGMTLEAIDPATNRTDPEFSRSLRLQLALNYVYDEVAPLLPAGTVLHMIGVHDNTAMPARSIPICGSVSVSAVSTTCSGMGQHCLPGRCDLRGWSRARAERIEIAITIAVNTVGTQAS
jgi:hypothetical protein